MPVYERKAGAFDLQPEPEFEAVPEGADIVLDSLEGNADEAGVVGPGEAGRTTYRTGPTAGAGAMKPLPMPESLEEEKRRLRDQVVTEDGKTQDEVDQELVDRGRSELDEWKRRRDQGEAGIEDVPEIVPDESTALPTPSGGIDIEDVPVERPPKRPRGRPPKVGPKITGAGIGEQGLVGAGKTSKADKEVSDAEALRGDQGQAGIEGGPVAEGERTGGEDIQRDQEEGGTPGVEDVGGEVGDKPSYKFLTETAAKHESLDKLRMELWKANADNESLIRNIKSRPIAKNRKAQQDRQDKQLEPLLKKRDQYKSNLESINSDMDSLWVGKDVERYDFMEYLSKGKQLPPERSKLYDDYQSTPSTPTPPPTDISSQLDEMSEEDIDRMLDEVEAERSPGVTEQTESEAETEAQAESEPTAETGIEIEDVPTGTTGTTRRPRTPKVEKPPRKKREKRTVADVLTSAAEHGVKGIDEAAQGLFELFGGKGLKSGVGAVDEDTYKKALPHFKAALEEFKVAGKDIKEFAKWCYDNFSAAIRPYVKQFMMEEKRRKKKITKFDKLQDAGEVLGGKRSGKDHRDRVEAIAIELDESITNATPDQIADALIRMTARSTHFKIEHAVEFRTPGVKRFLDEVRKKLPTWADSYDKEFRGWGPLKENIARKLGNNPELQPEIKLNAARYISVLEQMNEAAVTVVTVAEARQRFLNLLFGEENADKWIDLDYVRDTFGRNLSGIFGDTYTTDTGKALVAASKKRYDLSELLMTGWESMAAAEEERDKNQPIVRTYRNIFEIDTPETYRNGESVSPDTLMETFRLRGIDFGEWVEGDFRQRSVDLTYDSFKMLAEAIGAPDSGISLNDEQRLGIGWGARGRGGKTAAAFWPDNGVIGLTKTKGDGSLAHEWGHAFDFMIDRGKFMIDSKYNIYHDALEDLKLAFRQYYRTDGLEEMVTSLLTGMWSQTRNRVGRLEETRRFLEEEAIGAIKSYTEYFKNALALDDGEINKYWSKKEELWARAFEAYVADKLQGANTYLVDKEFVSPGFTSNFFNWTTDAYPTEKERERFNNLFESFFSQVEWSEDGVPSLKDGFVPVTILEKRAAEAAIKEISERVDKIYQALYGGEKSKDDLYWYAFEQSTRGIGAQPVGFMAYDDEHKLENTEDIVYAGKGAVGYTEPLIADDVLTFFLKPIQHEKNKTTIRLENPDGTISDMGVRGNEALEEASPDDVSPTGGTGGAGGGGTGGTDQGGGIGPGSDGGRSDVGGGEGDSTSEIDLPPLGGGSADTGAGGGSFQLSGKLNFSILPTHNFETSNLTERFNNNIAALRVLKKIEGEGRSATLEEQGVLVKYNGWGELSGALDNWPDPGWSGRAELVKTVLTGEEINAIRRSSLDAYYTPPSVAAALHEGLQRIGFTGGKVLEPSCGIGHFFGTMPKHVRRNSVLTGVDLDPIAARIATQLYQSGNFFNQGFEETKIPENFYDLTISNVPFGSSNPYDKVYNPTGDLKIHDYFIEKMIAVTKPGGIITVITSTGTLDKTDDSIREKWSKSVDLLGAIRLPNNIFPGAFSGADIIYFRKKGDNLPSIPPTPDWTKTSDVKLSIVDSKGIGNGHTFNDDVNNYFVENRDNVLGELAAYRGRWGYESYVHKHDSYKEKLRDAIDRLPTSIYRKESVPVDIDFKNLIPDDSFLKDFNHYVGEDGNIYQIRGGAPHIKDDLTADQIKKMTGMIGLRGQIRKILRAQVLKESDDTLQTLRTKLLESYNAFVSEHGPINLRENARLFLQDADAGLILSLEKWDRTTKSVKGLADIFTRNTIAEITPPQSVETPHEALIQSLLWRGKVDLPYMAKLSGMTNDSLIDGLRGQIFDDPEKGYVAADEYLSGNVRRKLAVAKSAAELDPKYQANIEALEVVMPVDLPMYDIHVRLGNSWVPAETVTDFVYSLFDYNIEGFHIDHIVETGQWVPHFRGRTKAQAKRNEENARNSSVASERYGVVELQAGPGTEVSWTGNDGQQHRGRVQDVKHGRARVRADSGFTYTMYVTDLTIESRGISVTRSNLFDVGKEKGLLYYSLNGGFPVIKDSVKIGEREDGSPILKDFVNVSLTDAANAKLATLQADFSRWISDNDNVSEILSRIYNDRFNSHVDRQYNGEHLVLPGKVPNELIKLRPHQLNAVWRFLQSGIAYFAHEVGTGKTYTMIASIMEARRLGFAKKPVMAVKKANMEQIAAEFLALYPGANILVMKVPENKEKRKEVFSRIATGNYDCIIVNHNSFEKIPLSVETQNEIISIEVNRLRAALTEATAKRASRHTVRDIENKIQKLQDKLKRAADAERDDIPTMEEMGIDMIVVDEAHTHKNIGFNTKYDNIKGVEAGGSSIAFDLFMKTQYITNKFGRNIILASGTPLTNSVGELFNIQRFLQSKDLDLLGISTFDAWANTFGIIEKEAEYAPEGGYFKMVSRFSEFVNIPELMSLARQYMDIRRAEDIGIVRPNMLGGKPETVMVDWNEYTGLFQDIMRSRVAEIRYNPRNAEYNGVNDNMLRLTSDGRLVAMDPRLYDSSLPDYPNTKTNTAIKRVIDTYKLKFDAIDLDPESKTYGKEYKESRHLQIIFCDRGVPKSGDKFDLYSDIKRKLIKGGIPANEVAFIHDAKNDDQKAELFRKAKAGEIRVLIGSTGKLGIGVNIQDRVSWIHHLDVDWTYANYEQRNGRGWRYGNRIKDIGVTNYGTKRTVDAFMWGTVAFKERILQQVLSNDPKIRNAKDVSKTSVNASEMEGLLADDPVHKEKIELEDEVRRLVNVKVDHESSRRRARDKLARNPLEIAAAEKAISNNHRHLQVAEAITAIEFKPGSGVNPVPFEGGRHFDLGTDGGKANNVLADIHKAASKKLTEDSPGILVARFGQIKTIEVDVIEKDKSGRDIKKKVKSKTFVPLSGYLSLAHAEEGGKPVRFKIGTDVNVQSPMDAGIKRGLNHISNLLLENVKEMVAREKALRNETEKLKKIAETPFDKEKELAEKEIRLRRITEELLARQDEVDARARAQRAVTEAGQDTDIQGGAPAQGRRDQREDPGGGGTTLYSGIPIDAMVQMVREMGDYIKKAGPVLEEIGFKLYHAGHDTLSSFKAAFQEALGDLYQKLKMEVFRIWKKVSASKAGDLARAVAAPLMNEMGAVSLRRGTGPQLKFPSKKDMRLGARIFQFAYDTARTFPDEFGPFWKAELDYWENSNLRVRGAWDTSKSYFRLKRVERENVDRILVKGDAEKKVYFSKVQEEGRTRYNVKALRELGLTSREIQGYLGIRTALDNMKADLVAEMKAAKLDEKKIADFEKNHTGYIPHRWYGKWALAVKAPNRPFKTEAAAKGQATLYEKTLGIKMTVVEVKDAEGRYCFDIVTPAKPFKTESSAKAQATKYSKLLGGEFGVVSVDGGFAIINENGDMLFAKSGERVVHREIHENKYILRNMLNDLATKFPGHTINGVLAEDILKGKEVSPSNLKEFMLVGPGGEELFSKAGKKTIHMEVSNSRGELRGVLLDLAKKFPGHTINGVETEKILSGASVNAIKREKMADDLYRDVIPPQIVQVLDQAVERGKIHPEVKKALASAMDEIFKAKGAGAYFIKRQGTLGYTEDLARPLAEYFNGISRYIEKVKKVRAFAAAFENEKLRKMPKLSEFARAYVRYNLGIQNSAVVDGIKTALFLKFLWLNLKSAVVNLSGLEQAAARLGSQKLAPPGVGKKATHYLGAESKMTTASFRVFYDWAGTSTEKVFAKLRGVHHDVAYDRIAGWEREAFDWAERRGYFNALYSDELSSQWGGPFKSLVETNFRRAMTLFMGLTEQFIRRTAYLAFLRALKKNKVVGLSGEELYREALRHVNETQGYYMKGNRPTIMRATSDSPVGQLIAPFTTFRGWFMNQITFIKNSFKDRDAPELMREILGLFVLTGLVGLPGYAVLSGGYKRLFGSNFETDYREVMTEVFGRTAARALTRGVPYSMGVDVSGSIGTGDSIPLSFEDIPGAVSVFYENWPKFLRSVEAEDYWRAIEDFPMTPEFVRFPMSAFREHTEGMTTRGGSPIINPKTGEQEKLSTGEAWLKSFGFMPSGASDRMRKFMVVKDAQEEMGALKTRYLDRIMKAINNNDRDAEKSIWMEIDERNRKYRGQIEKQIHITNQNIKSRMKGKLPPKAFGPLTDHVYEVYEE